MPKWTLANLMDLYLYPRHFEPLFREFFGKAARFCSRQSVEFWLAFLLVLPNAHSKHRCQRVSQLCDVSDVKTAGKPPPAPGRNHSVLAMLGREKAKHPLQLGKGEVGVKPSQCRVTPKSGSVFADTDSHSSCFNLRKHRLEAGVVIGHATHTIIHKECGVREMVFPCIPQKHIFLRRDLSRVFSSRKYNFKIII